MHLRFNWQALQQHTGNDSFNICTIIYNKENVIIMKFRSQSKDESNRCCHSIYVVYTSSSVKNYIQ